MRADRVHWRRHEAAQRPVGRAAPGGGRGAHRCPPGPPRRRLLRRVLAAGGGAPYPAPQPPECGAAGCRAGRGRWIGGGVHHPGRRPSRPVFADYRGARRGRVHHRLRRGVHVRARRRPGCRAPCRWRSARAAPRRRRTQRPSRTPVAPRARDAGHDRQPVPGPARYGRRQRPERGGVAAARRAPAGGGACRRGARHPRGRTPAGQRAGGGRDPGAMAGAPGPAPGADRHCRPGGRLGDPDADRGRGHTAISLQPQLGAGAARGW